jgi:hypothetical protein
VVRGVVQVFLKLHDSLNRLIILVVRGVSWKFHKNPIKLRFICAARSTSLTKLSRWLSSFYKVILPVVSDLWVARVKKVHVPSVNSWILNDSTGAKDVIELLTF